MGAGITIVGLGPSSVDNLTRKAWEILSNTSEIYVRTRHHPVIENLPDWIAIHSFDDLYAEADSFDEVYEEIVSRLVELANKNKKEEITKDDLTTVINKPTPEGEPPILNRENKTLQLFWTEFCRKKTEKETVKQILAEQTPTNKVSLSRLERHGYIEKDGGAWKIRVPLFEKWLRKFKDTF